MDILIDTNVILDVVLEREPYMMQSEEIYKLCLARKINGCIAAHTITNLFFILRKNKTVEERKAFLLNLCKIFTVVSLDSNKIISALKNSNFSDFEDCLQDECADDFNADYIVTRNIKDFANSKIKAILPEEFLSAIKS